MPWGGRRTQPVRERAVLRHSGAQPLSHGLRVGLGDERSDAHDRPAGPSAGPISCALTGTTWADFLRNQPTALLACDLFEVRTLTGARLYAFAVIEHTTSSLIS